MIDSKKNLSTNTNEEIQNLNEEDVLPNILNDNDHYFIVSPNGVGKSTLCSRLIDFYHSIKRKISDMHICNLENPKAT